MTTKLWPCARLATAWMDDGAVEAQLCASSLRGAQLGIREPWRMQGTRLRLAGGLYACWFLDLTAQPVAQTIEAPGQTRYLHSFWSSGTTPRRWKLCRLHDVGSCSNVAPMM